MSSGPAAPAEFPTLSSSVLKLASIFDNGEFLKSVPAKA
jgi:hypothetical protein